MGVLGRLKTEGKIRHSGLSAVGVEQIERARLSVEIATVQNEYNLGTRKHEDVVDYCTEHSIDFIPFYPLKIGQLAESADVKEIAAREGVAQTGDRFSVVTQQIPGNYRNTRDDLNRPPRSKCDGCLQRSSLEE